MSNLLAIPFKKTYTINLQPAVRQYISDRGGAHPDEFREDIRQWQVLREAGVGGVAHENRVESALLYNAQLVSILTKLPTDIQLPIAYATVFKENALPVTLNNLAFERASVIFNIASLYSQLAVSQDRSTTEGIKRAATNYQLAAGTFSFLGAHVIPNIVYSPDDEETPKDLSTDLVKGLEWLMLAQAQECTWQLAKLSQYKNSLIAKIAAGTAALYSSAAATIREVPSVLPSDWLPHIEAKEQHFSAVAEYRESLVEYEARRYGVELGRLNKSSAHAKKAYDIARRGRVASAVLNDIQSLLETVKKSEIRAQRDNDLIYHQDVPSSAALPPLQRQVLVSATVPKNLSNPQSMLTNQHVLFSDLAGWGTQEAINIYNDNRDSLIQLKIIDAAQELQDQADEALRRLNLPSALEALERPVGLPPSLLAKAEEVRLEDGPAKIESALEAVAGLAHQDMAILEEALDILDNEASEDEAARREASLPRMASHEANVELIEKATRYRAILSQASESDETVRMKWDEWEECIAQLTLDEDVLEASVPSTTGSSAAQSTPQAQLTRDHARALRVKLEDLASLHDERERLVHRARSQAAVDDIRPRIMEASAGFEQLSKVTPDMFQDIADEELAKFDRFLSEMDDIARRQAELLSEIQNRNTLLLESRKEDPIVKAREQALQSLDLAYFKYKEILRNLDEGFKFYNDLAGILVQFKEVCKTWGLQRKQEIHSYKRSMQAAQSLQAMKLSDGADPAGHDGLSTGSNPDDSDPQYGAAPARNTKASSGKSSSGLPALNSADWGFEELTLPPGPGGKQ